MRALILGGGSIGNRHARNIEALRPGVKLTVMRRRELAGTPDCAASVVHTMDAALCSAPDVAVIATPTHMHLEAIEALLSSGIPCYVEKPVVSDLPQAHSLRALLARMPAVPPTQTGCNLRFLPSLTTLRAMLREGAIGTVVRAHLEVGQWLPDWRPYRDYRDTYSAKAAQGGGVILDLVHELDQARWLFGEFERVEAIAGKYSNLEIDSEDTACVLLGRHRAPPAVVVSLDYVSRQRVRRYSIVGDEGSLVWDLADRSLKLMRGDSTKSVDSSEAGFDMPDTYMCAMRAFLDNAAAGRSGPQDLHDGLLSTELALQAKAAAGR